MRQKSLSRSFKYWASKEANVWVTVLAVLFVILMAWLWNSRIAGKVSDAAGLSFFQKRVTLVNGDNKAYPDFITIAPGTSIKIGYKSSGMRSCSPSWRPVPIESRSLAAEAYGPIPSDMVLEVKCYTGKGIVYWDSLQVRTGIAASGDFPISKPTNGDVWELGKTYQIQWLPVNTPQCGRLDLGCDANPVDDTDVVNCIKAPCNPTDPLPPQVQSVTISLNAPQPECLQAEPPCKIKQIVPFIITESAQNSGTYAWTIPADLPTTYWGKQQITIAVNNTDLRAQSNLFSIVESKDTLGSDLRVISPNGGEKWGIGQTKQIRWTAPADLKAVTIKLVEWRNCTEACTSRADRQYVVIADTANDGTYEWTVGKSASGEVALGSYRMVIEDTAGHSDESDNPFAITTLGVSDTSGIEGTVKIGPTCGGPIGGDVSGCEDKPYQTTINVKTADGSRIITTFKSGVDGTFRVRLDPGTYLLTSGTSGRLPSLSPETVVVKANEYTHIDLTFDSGIR